MAEGTKETLAESADKATQPESHQFFRFLALDIRPRKIGFVVFEGSKQLLDWGVSHFPQRQKSLEIAVAKRIGRLLDFHAPVAVVVQKRIAGSSKDRKGRGLVLRIIRKEAKRRSITIHLVSMRMVRKFFHRYGCETKNQIASMIASWFEEMHWKLPPKRKPWQSEHPNMAIFDAAALGIAYSTDFKPTAK